MPITDQDRAEMDATCVAPDIHLTTGLRHLGAEILAEAATLRGLRLGSCARELHLHDLREAVSEACATMAAYDTAIAAGRATVTVAEFREMKKGAKPRTQVVGRVTGKPREGDQVPGMPNAICHACGLGYKCGDADCPNDKPNPLDWPAVDRF